MTPLVDIAFLLLTFFVYTYSQLQPQIMEVSLPNKGSVDYWSGIDDTPFPTVRVDSAGGIYWNVCLEMPKKIRIEELRGRLSDLGASTRWVGPRVKIDRRANYGLMIDIMDELQAAKVGGISLEPMYDQDKTILNHVQ